ncbi:MAG TPA: thioredoxin family protein [Desulfobacteraceae bacterium]|nr:thioredoxin family protein [Desulfobacteraceae bacterium]HDL98586.1 thioredoxin family protein [Desulfobacteraceae bacterium]HDO30615.1 thioredoxin family protein [Desulfobacteraceae bacterium]
MFKKGQFSPILQAEWLACPLQLIAIMKRIRFTIIFCILSLLALPAPKAFSSEIKMLFFYRIGCSFCTQMEKIINEPDIKSLLLGRAQVIRINMRSRKKMPAFGKGGVDLAKEFKVYGAPTIILVGTGEKVLLKIPGALTKQDFRDVVCQYVPGIGKKKGCVGKTDAL